MTVKDIRAALKDNPSVPFAVRVKVGRVRSQVVKAEVEDLLSHRVYVHVDAETLSKMPSYERLEAGDVTVTPASVLDTWESWTFNRDHEEAIRMDRSRDERIEYDRKRAERAAAIEAWLPAFAGINIPATGSSNFDRDDVDLAEELRDTFIRMGASGSMFRAEHFEAIAKRIRELETLLIEQSGGWGGGARDTGIPSVDPSDAAQAAVAALERMAE